MGSPPLSPRASTWCSRGRGAWCAPAATLTARTVGAVSRPSASAELLRDAAEGLGELVWAGMNPAPDTPLNVEIGPHRRYAAGPPAPRRLQRSERTGWAATVNDVVLTVVSGAIADWLHARGVQTRGLEMRALVPVSVRSAAARGALGNQLSVIRGPLPVYIEDPVARLRYVSHAMNGLKESKQAVGAATLVAVNSLAPPTILAQASRVNFSTRLFNLIVTNVPGPQVPLYLLGRQLQDLFPVAFLPDHHALAIAIMSYNGSLDFGLLADYDAIPDIEVLAEGIDRALAQLLAAARGESAEAATESVSDVAVGGDPPLPIHPRRASSGAARAGGGYARQAHAGGQARRRRPGARRRAGRRDARSESRGGRGRGTLTGAARTQASDGELWLGGWQPNTPRRGRRCRAAGTACRGRRPA